MADAEERDGGDDFRDLINHVAAMISRGGRWSQPKGGGVSSFKYSVSSEERAGRSGGFFGASKHGAGRSKDGLDQDDPATMKKLDQKPSLHFLPLQCSMLNVRCSPLPLPQIRDRLEDRGDHQVGHGADEAGHDDQYGGHDQGHDALKVLVEFLVVAFGRAAQ